MIEQNQEAVWSALGNLLNKQIETLKEEERSFKIEAIDLILITLIDLFPHTRPGKHRHNALRIGRSEEEEQHVTMI